jgi:hypothetical protein
MSLTPAGDSQAAESLDLWRPGLEDTVMGTAIGLREDFDAAGLRRLARASRSANQARRLLALAQIYGGGSRSDAA